MGLPVRGDKMEAIYFKNSVHVGIATLVVFFA